MSRKNNRFLAFLLALALVTTTFSSDYASTRSFAVGSEEELEQNEESSEEASEESSEESSELEWEDIEEETPTENGENPEKEVEAESGDDEVTAETPVDQATEGAVEEATADITNGGNVAEEPATDPATEATTEAVSASTESTESESASAATSASTEASAAASSSASIAADAASSASTEAEKNLVTVTYKADKGGTVSKREETVDLNAKKVVFEGSVASPWNDKWQFTEWVDEDGNHVTNEALLVPSDVEKDTTFTAKFMKLAEMPEISESKITGGMNVSVEAEEGLFPEGTTVSIEAIPETQALETAQDTLGDNVKEAKGVDIKFIYNKDEIQPADAKYVHVSISLVDKIEGTDFTVLHEHEGEVKEIEAAVATEEKNADPEDETKVATGVVLDSNEFSVFIVASTTEDHKQYQVATYRFYGKQYGTENNEQLFSKLVKKGDKLASPGVPEIDSNQTFYGWYIYEDGKKADAITFDKSDVHTVGEVENGKVYEIYPVMVTTYYVTFIGLEGEIWKVDRVDVEDITDEEQIIHTFDDDNHKIPAKAGSAFKGWSFSETDNNYVTQVNVTEDSLTLYAHEVPAYWVRFEGNGSGSTFTGPVFVEGTDTLRDAIDKVKNPTRPGYDVFLGWSFDSGENNVAITNAQLDSTIDNLNTVVGKNVVDENKHELYLYARWKMNEKAAITVVEWHENLNGEYDYIQSYRYDENYSGGGDLRVNSGSEVKVSFSDGGNRLDVWAGTDNRWYKFNDKGNGHGDYGEGFAYTSDNGSHYTIKNSKGEDVTAVTPDGGTIVNIYVNRKNVTINFYTNNNNRPSKTITGKYGSSLGAGKWDTNYTWYKDRWHSEIQDIVTSYITDANYYGVRNYGYSSIRNVYHYKETDDGKYNLDSSSTISVDYPSSEITLENKFEGYSVSYYYLGNSLSLNKEYWTEASANSKVSLGWDNNNNIYIFHTKNKYNCTFEIYNTENERVSHDIISNLPYGTVLEDVPEVKEYIDGSKRPDEIVGYKFGWFKDLQGRTEYDFSTTVAECKTHNHDNVSDGGAVVFGLYIPVKYKVTLDANGGIFTGQLAKIEKEESNPQRGYFTEYATKIERDNLITGVEREDYALIGWYYYDENGNYVEYKYGVLTGDIELFAEWRYTGTVRVKYDANGGKFSNNETEILDGARYGANSSAIAAGAPNKEKSTFVGWRVTGDDSKYYPNDIIKLTDAIVEEAETITDSTGSYRCVVIKAQYVTNGDIGTSEERTSIYYHPNGGEVNGVVLDSDGLYCDDENILVNYQVVAKGDIFKKTGYSLDNWNTQSGGSGLSIDKNEKIAADKLNRENPTNPSANILYAQWSPVEYSITYNLDKGALDEGVTNPATYTVETDSFTLNNPTREGYTFVGWSGTGLSGTENKDVTISKGSTGNRTYTANWSVNSYKVTYKLPDDAPTDSIVKIGENTGSSLTAYHDFGTEFATSEAKVTVPTGYTFKGWALENTTPILSTYTMPANNDTVFVAQIVTDTSKWKYSIKFFKQNITDDEYTEDTKAAVNDIPASSTKKVSINDIYTTYAGTYGDNFTLDHYNTSAVSTDSTNFNVEVSVTAEGFVINLYYDRKNHTVTFDPMDGTLASSSDASQTVRHGGVATKPLDPSQEGYSFVGWYTDKDTLQNAYVFTTPVESDITLYAKYQINTYQVTFDPNDGTLAQGTTSPVTVNWGEKVTKPSDPTREGYSFDGWFEGSATTSFDFNTLIKEDKTLVAHWTPVEYEIVYVLNGGVFADDATVEDPKNPNPTTYNITSDPITLINPTKQGYIFDGWTEVVENGGAAVISGKSETVTIPTGNFGKRTYTAHWTTVGTKTYYTVQHYKENLDGTFETNPSYEETDRFGETEAVLKDFEDNYSIAGEKKEGSYDFTGFEYDHSDPASYTTIAADGSTVIKLYYKRVLKRVTYKDGYTQKTEGGTEDVLQETEVKYGSTIPAYSKDGKTEPERTGFAFNGWLNNGTLVSEDFFTGTVTEDIVLVADWEQTDFPAYYRVEYYYQNKAGNDYVIDDDETEIFGPITVNTKTTYEGQTEKGKKPVSVTPESSVTRNFVNYTLVETAPSVLSDLLTKDNSNDNDKALVLKVYYNRSSFGNQLVIAAKSNSRAYNGEALTESGFTVNGTESVNGKVTIDNQFEISATVDGSQINVGSAENKITKLVIKNTGNNEEYTYDLTDGTISIGDDGVLDQSDFTKITVTNGTLSVTAKDITIISESDSKTYDGTALSKESVVLKTGEGYENNTLVGTDTLKDLLSFSDFTETLVGQGIPNNYEYTVKSLEDGGKALDASSVKDTDTAKKQADNYNFIKNYGTLTVNPVGSTDKVIITAPSAEKKYDGTALSTSDVKDKASGTYGTVTITAGSVTGLLGDDEARYDLADVSVTNVSDNADRNLGVVEKDGKPDVRIYNGDTDVTENYPNIEVVKGTLKIKEREVTLTSKGAEKAYDETALTFTDLNDKDMTAKYARLTVSGDGFVSDNDRPDITFTGSRTEVGGTGLKEDTFTFSFGGNTTLSNNYKITPVSGDLVVTDNYKTVKIYEKFVYADTSKDPVTKLVKEVTVADKLQYGSSFSYDISEYVTAHADDHLGFTLEGSSKYEIAKITKDEEYTFVFNQDKYTVTYVLTDEASLPQSIVANKPSAEKAYYVYGETFTVADPMNETGYDFDGWYFGESKVSGEFTVKGNTEFKGTFTIHTHSVTYQFDPASKPKNTTLEEPEGLTGVKYGETVTVAKGPEAAGYTFLGWKPAGLVLEQGATYVGTTFNMQDSDVVLTGYYQPKSDTKYTVKYYEEKTTGGYDLDNPVKTREDLTGTTDADLTEDDVPIDPEEGFELDKIEYVHLDTGEKVDPVIRGDGKLLVNVFYKRIEYEVEYRYTGTYPDEAVSLLPATVKHKFGTTVVVADNVEVTGYDFSGWSPDSTISVVETQAQQNVVQKIVSFVKVALGQDASKTQLQFEMPAGKVVIVGSFTKKQYEIKYIWKDADGNSKETVIKAEFEDPTPVPEIFDNPEAPSNSYFEKWVDKDNEEVTREILSDRLVTENATYTAVYQDKIKVNVKLKGGDAKKIYIGERQYAGADVDITVTSEGKNLLQSVRKAVSGLLGIMTIRAFADDVVKNITKDVSYGGTDYTISGLVLTDGSGIDVDKYPVYLETKDVKVTMKVDGEDVTVTDRFAFGYTYEKAEGTKLTIGYLEITPREVNLSSESATQDYNGTALTRPVVTTSGDGFLDTEVTNVRATGTITNAGKVENTIAYDIIADKYKGNDKLFNTNYTIKETPGTLIVNAVTPAPTPTPTPTPTGGDDPTPAADVAVTPAPVAAVPAPAPAAAVLGARREDAANTNGAAVLGARRAGTDDQTDDTSRAFAIVIAAAVVISLFVTRKKKEEE